MKLVQLGEVCSIINGGTPDTKVPEYWNGQHAWITPAEMGNLATPYLGNSRRKLTDLGMQDSSAQLLPKHSIILSSRAPIGHLVINEIPMAFNQGCKGLIPHGSLFYKYLYYFLYANKAYLNALGSGTTFMEISGSKLKTVGIPLPSLEKQREIVEKLDSAFAEIALLNQNTDSQILIATQLFNQEIDQMLNPEQEGWLSKKLSDWCENIGTGPFGSVVHKADYVRGGIPLINPSNIGDGFIIHDDIKGVSAQKASELLSYRLLSGDIVLGRRGEMGRCAVVSKAEEGWLCGTGSFYLRPRKDCHPLLLSRVIRSQRVRAKLERISTGVTMSNLNNRALGLIEISLPPKNVQETILRKINNLEGAIASLVISRNRKLELLAELRDSALRSTFREAS